MISRTRRHSTLLTRDPVNCLSLLRGCCPIFVDEVKMYSFAFIHIEIIALRPRTLKSLLFWVLIMNQMYNKRRNLNILNGWSSCVFINWSWPFNLLIFRSDYQFQIICMLGSFLNVGMAIFGSYLFLSNTTQRQHNQMNSARINLYYRNKNIYVRVIRKQKL